MKLIRHGSSESKLTSSNHLFCPTNLQNPKTSDLLKKNSKSSHLRSCNQQMFDTRLNSDELLWFLGSWHCECRLSITRLRLTVAYFETVQLITAVCPTQVHTVFTQADKKNILKRYESKTYPSVGYFHRPLLCKAQHRLLSFTPRMSSTDIVGW